MSCLSKIVRMININAPTQYVQRNIFQEILKIVFWAFYHSFYVNFFGFYRKYLFYHLRMDLKLFKRIIHCTLLKRIDHSIVATLRWVGCTIGTLSAIARLVCVESECVVCRKAQVPVQMCLNTRQSIWVVGWWAVDCACTPSIACQFVSVAWARSVQDRWYRHSFSGEMTNLFLY
jgi:hypothetical protein